MTSREFTLGNTQATVDIFRCVRFGLYAYASYRNKAPRANFVPQYGVDIRFIHGATRHVAINIFLHRYALFVVIGRRFRWGFEK